MTVYRPLLVFILACMAMWNGPAMAADPSINPCNLVKKGEVEQIVGRPMGNPTSERTDKVRMCTFLFSSDPSDALERAKKDIKDLSPVAGLGQEAFLHRDKKFEYVRLFVKKGKCWKSI